MYITVLSAGTDAGPEEGGPIAQPSLQDVETAVRALDGHSRTMVVLGTAGPGHMAVGGGNGRFIVYTTMDNLSFWVPTDPLAPEGSVRLIAGGEEGEFPSRQTVDRETALRAARTYALHGTMDESLLWEKA